MDLWEDQVASWSVAHPGEERMYRRNFAHDALLLTQLETAVGLVAWWFIVLLRDPLDFEYDAQELKRSQFRCKPPAWSYLSCSLSTASSDLETLEVR